MNNEQQHPAPWYRQPWLWFILAPIIAVVIYGTFFLYLAITTHDGVVKDDYYKVARGHFVDNSKTQKAANMEIKATLTLDNPTGDMMLMFLNQSNEYPELLKLSIIHPTHQNYDQTMLLKRVGETNSYSGNLKSPLKGKRYVILEDTNSTWSIRADAYPPYEQKSMQLNATVQ